MQTKFEYEWRWMWRFHHHGAASHWFRWKPEISLRDIKPRNAFINSRGALASSRII
jgi:hypothetical protein